MSVYLQSLLYTNTMRPLRRPVSGAGHKLLALPAGVSVCLTLRQLDCAEREF